MAPTKGGMTIGNRTNAPNTDFPKKVYFVMICDRGRESNRARNVAAAAIKRLLKQDSRTRGLVKRNEKYLKANPSA